ncbi:ATP-binding protein [Anaerolineales bacterium HSG6]|nr:ATP-binding protein [Anaerolineales bacterium HSG6]MDM8532145.1 ATP-binding protein [Anaerolineales bacterium HSG25]
MGIKQLGKASATITQQAVESPTNAIENLETVSRFKGMAELLEPPPSTDDLDVPPTMIIDILLRLLYNEGEVTAIRVEEVLKLPYKVCDDFLTAIQQEHLIEVAKAQGSLGRRSYVYRPTDKGRARGKEAMERTLYVGPAPVPLEKYTKSVTIQAVIKRLSRGEVQDALSHLILPPDFDRKIGPAVNAGTSIFLYGPPGNGKTTISEAIAELLGGNEPIWIPYAITVGGSIIQIYDQLIHIHSDAERGETDKRWGLFKRPSVMVGGELTMDHLELRYEAVAKYYEGPLQMKANGGMFLIDDFGRQHISPTDLLNRWIVPLETRIDFLRLNSGMTFEIPFKQLLVFSTNLDPEELVDGAFLRRIQLKVPVYGPDEKMFYQIFVGQAKALGFPDVDRDSFIHLLRKWYIEPGKPLQSVHPRDILKAIRVLCEYAGEPLHMTPELVEEACNGYFVKASDGRIL